VLLLDLLRRPRRRDCACHFFARGSNELVCTTPGGGRYLVRDKQIFRHGAHAMKERTTQLLLAAVAVLLAVHLFHPGPAPAAPGGEAGKAPGSEVGEAAGAPSVVRAQLFELVDARGRVIGQLYPGVDGGGNLRLRTGDGTIRVKLGATAEGSGLLLMDAQPEPAVSLASGKSGTSITLAEKGKEKRVLKP